MANREARIKKLSPVRQERIKARAQQLISQEMTLQQLRKARKMSQETMAELLNMRQGDVSKLERRTDVYISTVRRYVEALGGKLELLVSFPDSEPVKIENFSSIADDAIQYEQDERESLTKRTAEDAPPYIVPPTD